MASPRRPDDEPGPDDLSPAGPVPGDPDVPPDRARGSLLPRLSARVLDTVLLLVVTEPIRWLDADGWVPFALFTAAIGVYDVVGVAGWGQTPGKWLHGLKVVDRRSGALPSPLAATVRWFGLLYWVPLVDLRLYWTVIVLAFIQFGSRLGPHDRLAATEVVVVPPGRLRRGRTPTTGADSNVP
jgi:uncharacterized RDD family membrane protein YckC